MKSNLYLIVRREYLERVTRKSFILTTILMPLLMLGLMMAPALIMVLSGPENKTIAVIDASGQVGQTLQGGDEIEFVQISPTVSIDSVKRLTDYDAVLVIGSNVVDKPDNVQMYTHSAPSMQTEEFIRSQLGATIENIRIKRYDIDNLAEIMASVRPHVSMSTYRIGEDTEEETSSIVSYMLGLVVTFLLYMFILLYGQMVMTSIIEEKNNRVLEIVVSSVRPKVLMLGKILGVGLVALTQILIWAVLIGCFTAFVMPMVKGSIDTDDLDLLTAMSQLGDPGFVFMLFGYITLFLIGGYLLYSSIYAAIGSAVDNAQDATQLSSIAMVPIILGMVCSMSVVADPNSHLAFWMSMIPFTSPMVMMARVPFGIPAWEIWTSIVLLIATSLFMVWVAAKIYRVGIFMYGKKPNISDLIKWARYK